MTDNTHTRVGSRFWLIIALLVLLVFFAWLLYNRSKSIEQFKDNIKIIFADDKLDKVDSCISALYLAENNNRFFLLTKDSVYLNRLNDEMAKVKNLTLELEKIMLQSGKDEYTLSVMVDEKLKINDKILNLSAYTDSLLKLSENIQSLNAQNKRLKVPKALKNIDFRPVVTVDTLIDESKEKVVEFVVENKKHQSLLKRIANAIANKGRKNNLKRDINENFKARKVVTKKIELDTSSIDYANYNKMQINKINKHYLEYINTKAELDKEQVEVLTLNSKIFTELKMVLFDLKHFFQLQHSVKTTNFRDSLKLSIDQYGLNATGLITIIALLAFIVVVNLRKLYRDERELMIYSQQVYEYANHNKEFLANMSHELRTPLNSIIGFSEQLEKSDLDSQSSEYVAAIQTSSTMLLGTVNDILDFSRLELDKVTLVNQSFYIKSLINDSVTSIGIQAEKKGLILKTHIENITDTTCLRGDAFRIKQILLNLLSNAIKYTQKGEVALTVKLEAQEGDSVLLYVEVKDTGIGIDEKHLSLIFDKFAQISDAEFTEWQTGTGLGLAITKRIVLLFDGEINVESKINEGSIFSFILPLKIAQIETFETENVKASFEKVDFKDIKVLLVDDNLMNIKLAGVLLEKWDIKYEVAFDGRKALELFENNDFSLVLTDVQMPFMNGVELTKAIRKLSDPVKSKVAIVGITANVLKNDIMEYMDAGMNDILLKPYSEEEYLSKILIGKRV